MKQKILNLTLLLFCMIVGMGSAWGETCEWAISEVGYNNQYQFPETVKLNDDISIQFDNSGNKNNATKYYTSGTAMRIYAKNSMTIISKQGNITGVTFTYGSSDGSNTITANCGEFDVSQWSGDSKSVKFTIGGTSGNRRIAKIVVTYEEGSAPQKYNVVLADNIEGGMISASLTSATEGTEITLTATSKAGYMFASWNVLYEESNKISVTDNKFTMPASDVFVSAIFEEIVIPNYTITWSVNGETTSSSVKEGETISFEAPSKTSINGKTFVGWVEEEIDGTTDTTPSFVTSATANKDITYFAVYAKKEGAEPVCEELTNQEIQSLSSERSLAYNTETKYSGELLNYSIYGYTDNKNRPWVQLRKDLGCYIKVIAPEKVSRIELIITGASNSSGGVNDITMHNAFQGTVGVVVTDIAFYEKSNNIGATNIIEDNIASIELDKEVSEFYIKVSIGARIWSIKTYMGELPSYSGYCTTVSPETTPETATITLYAACTDGEYVYGTYSNSSAFVVPEELIVSEISIKDNNTLDVKPYNPRDVVPANTGVMVSALEGGDYTVTLSNEVGTSVLGASNYLHPSSEPMTGDNLFYRLTMHNGTQIGYWWGAENGAAFNLAANKAYLAVPKEKSVKANLWFGGAETSISAPEALNAENGVIYNLNGQRVSSATKGIYIKNGKKYFVK